MANRENGPKSTENRHSKKAVLIPMDSGSLKFFRDISFQILVRFQIFIKLMSFSDFIFKPDIHFCYMCVWLPPYKGQKVI